MSSEDVNRLRTPKAPKRVRPVQVRHEVWLCECLACRDQRERQRELFRRVRARLYAPVDDSTDDPTVLVE